MGSPTTAQCERPHGLPCLVHVMVLSGECAACRGCAPHVADARELLAPSPAGVKASRFAVAWFVQPPGCLTGSWFWECYEDGPLPGKARFLSMGCFGARPWRGPHACTKQVQQAVATVAGVNAAAVAVVRGGPHG